MYTHLDYHKSILTGLPAILVCTAARVILSHSKSDDVTAHNKPYNTPVVRNQSSYKGLQDPTVFATPDTAHPLPHTHARMHPHTHTRTHATLTWSLTTLLRHCFASHQPPCYASATPSVLLPQGLCTCSFLCLDSPPLHTYRAWLNPAFPSRPHCSSPISLAPHPYHFISTALITWHRMYLIYAFIYRLSSILECQLQEVKDLVLFTTVPLTHRTEPGTEYVLTYLFNEWMLTTKAISSMWCDLFKTLKICTYKSVQYYFYLKSNKIAIPDGACFYILNTRVGYFC